MKDGYGSIENWNVSNIIDMNHMFFAIMILTKIYQNGMFLMLLICVLCLPTIKNLIRIYQNGIFRILQILEI